MSQPYKWICTACAPETVFYGESAVEAQRLFFEHCAEVHPRASIVSIPPKNT